MHGSGLGVAITKDMLNAPTDELCKDQQCFLETISNTIEEHKIDTAGHDVLMPIIQRCTERWNKKLNGKGCVTTLHPLKLTMGRSRHKIVLIVNLYYKDVIDSWQDEVHTFTEDFYVDNPEYTINAEVLIEDLTLYINDIVTKGAARSNDSLVELPIYELSYFYATKEPLKSIMEKAYSSESMWRRRKFNNIDNLRMALQNDYNHLSKEMDIDYEQFRHLFRLHCSKSYHQRIGSRIFNVNFLLDDGKIKLTSYD